MKKKHEYNNNNIENVKYGKRQRGLITLFKKIARMFESAS
jgi:hypothetical protein